ncbi:sulfatase-like hydrolase/transferase [Akkermansiaceae bacterium]|nr:sulfatase-like hydrolase/transferase [Akkermansiaceae bacterium]MDA7888489.1 sulfatase-like hydrolase/transferase [Akkermansiaceae bacterium]
MKYLPLFLLCQLAAQAAEKPNLIVIMADDLGYADVGFNGCTDIPTPHIDSIVKNGVKFTSGYAAYSVCGPSRAAFMTGRYGQRFGFERNPQYQTKDENMGLPFSEETIANHLGKAGYHSGVIGKWHLGATRKHHPLNRGFQEFYGHLGGGHQYFPEMLKLKDSYAAESESESYRTWIMKNHEPVPPRKYLTDDFSDEAVGFIARNHEKPFFLFLSYNAPHTPLQAAPKYLDRFPGIKDKKRKIFAAMVSAVDDGVGRVLGELRKKKIAENTMIFFLSDNGGPSSKNASNNAPLRGAKGDGWEGGYRVPFAVQWTSGLPKGTTYDHPVSALDICATITGLNQVEIAAARPLDGVNLVPYLKGEKSEAPHESIFLRKFDSGISAVRSGDYKYLSLEETGAAYVFNLTKDIGERNSILEGSAEQLEKLRGLWANWNTSNIDPVFLGLIHSKEWKKRAAQKKKKEASGK